MSVKVYRPPWRRFTRWPYWMNVRMAKRDRACPGYFVKKGPPAVITGPRHER